MNIKYDTTNIAQKIPSFPKFLCVKDDVSTLPAILRDGLR